MLPSVEDVLRSLNTAAPQLDPGMVEDLKHARSGALAAHRAHGPTLWLFLARDHGALLAAEGPDGAGLYAPLRVILYEDAEGLARFEYDLPDTVVGQFGDPELADVGRELDRALEDSLRGLRVARVETAAPSSIGRRRPPSSSPMRPQPRRDQRDHGRLDPRVAVR